MKKISFIIMLFFAIASGVIAQNEIDSDKIFTKDELTELPQFHGGEDALNKYLLNNLKYPVVAEENGIQGLVNVSFIVRRDGTITDIKAVGTVDPSLAKEAVRLVKAMPRWEPGKANGLAVNAGRTIPIVFRIQ